MGKKREDSPSVESLRKRTKKIQDQIEKKINEKIDVSIQRRNDAIESEDQKNSHNSETSSVPPSDLEIEEEIVNKENIDINSDTLHKDLEETDSVRIADCAELDEETLAILEEDGISKNDKKFFFHPMLAASWEKVMSDGLKKDKKAELLVKYPRIGNCPILTPKLNPEIEASVNETGKKKDRFLVVDQELRGASLPALGTGISMIFNDTIKEVDTKELIKILVEAGKLMCELNSQLTEARKAFSYLGLDRKTKAILEKSKMDEFLFGSELSERIKTVKSVEKLGLSLKTPAAEKKPVFHASATLNWRGPSGAHREQTQAGYKRQNFQRQYPQSGFQGKGRQTVQNQGLNRPSTTQSSSTVTKK